MPTPAATTAQIKLWLSPDHHQLEADIVITHPDGKETHHQAYLSNTIMAMPPGLAPDRYPKGTVFMNRTPYRHIKPEVMVAEESLLPLGPERILVGLLLNLRGWLAPSDLKIALSLNQTAVDELAFEGFERTHRMGADGAYRLTVEQLVSLGHIEPLIDPS